LQRKIKNKWIVRFKNKQIVNNKMNNKIQAAINDNGNKESVENQNIKMVKSGRRRDNNHSTLRILGKEEELDKYLSMRVKWGQRGAAFFCSVVLGLYILASNIGATNGQLEVYTATIIFSVFAMLCLYIVMHKNISKVILLRLLKETKVVICLCGAISILFIDTYRPENPISPVLSLFYLLAVVSVVFLDALRIKSRIFVIVLYVLFVAINIYNILHLTIGTEANNVSLASYDINNETVHLWKRSTKRSIFIQVLLFSVRGVWICFKDKRMELMMFATGNIYKDSGNESKYAPPENAEEGINAQEENNVNRNSWWAVATATSSIINNPGKRTSVMLLGTEFVLDDRLVARISMGQKGVAIFGFIGLVLYIIGSVLNNNAELYIAAIVINGAVFVFLGIIFWRNVSFIILKRLMREPNVIIILASGVSIYFP
jgi:hypothetical protein